jgi:excisionase family DNA binding protein
MIDRTTSRQDNSHEDRFGRDLTVSDAAERLGVKPQRVRALIKSGDLKARRIGERTLLIDAESVERRAVSSPRAGRRLSELDAWGLILLAAGEGASSLDRRSRYRMRQLLDAHGLSGLRARLSARASLVHLRAHPSELGALRKEAAIVWSGPTAATDLRLGLLASDALDGYVAQPDVEPLLGRYHLRQSRDPNVILRVVSSLSWLEGRRYAPLSAIALDLFDDADPRSREVGQTLIARLEGEWTSRRSTSRQPRTPKSSSGG